jgi:hypothetical protein
MVKKAQGMIHVKVYAKQEIFIQKRPCITKAAYTQVTSANRDRLLFRKEYTTRCISLSNLCPTLEIFALLPSFFHNLASGICALRPTYCIFSQIWVRFMLYSMRPTFMKSTPR